MQKTIQIIDPQTRTWTPKDGSYTLVFVQGQFTDGSGFSYATKPESASKRLAELQALVGVPGEFVLEPKGEFNGQPQFKLKDYPGKPQPRGGFGGGGISDEQIELLAQRVAEQVVGMLNGVTPAAPVAAQPQVSEPMAGGATLKQVKAIKELAKSIGVTDEGLLHRAGVAESLMEMTKKKAEDLLAELTQELLNAGADES